VKLFSGYDRERERYAVASGLVKSLRLKTWYMAVTMDGILGLLTSALEAGLLIVGFYLWRRGILTAGDFVLIQSYVIRLTGRVWEFAGVVRDIYESLGDAEDMTVILNTPHEIRDRRGARPLVVTKGKIELKDVTFNYNATRSVLEHFNLTIAPQEKVALVGPSGAGKSTIVKLLLRMHDTTDGDILIDGQSIKKVTLESLWSGMSFVPQDPILFHRTLRENIRYGKPDATDAEVEAAAKLAHCHEFIMESSDSYDTYVGERGIKLSGGERQRIAIARAILRNAPILILDEATSSLDSESERLIQDALRTLMQGKTVIVIAHRLSTIMTMDRIVVVDSGRVTEMGTHSDLLQQKNGLYQRLWDIQAGGFLPDTQTAAP
jgi:ABC-type multidrug transport system fused ATPase/permease subunit